jgi:hypothetical protein
MFSPFPEYGARISIRRGNPRLDHDRRRFPSSQVLFFLVSLISRRQAMELATTPTLLPG